MLWVGKALVPERGEFDEKAHLGWEDKQLEDATNPTWILVKDQRVQDRQAEREGVFVTLPRTDLEICLVRAILEFMVVRKAVAIH